MTSPDPPDSTHASNEDTESETARSGAHTSGETPGSFGPYRLLSRIGEGGMGEVWLAEQTQPVRRQVALKIIKAGMDTKHVVARFEAERQALAMMDHPSIAKVFDAGETPQGRPYFVMEYVKGVPITEYCDRRKLTNRERLALFVEVCDGIQHAHQKAIIHRDIKPSNVLVTVVDAKAAPKIIDFGVAKAISQRLTEKTMFTELGVMIGTPEYMSPEQAEMTDEGVDTRSDVYALGVMLYELLVGALPFEPRSLRSAGYAEIARRIREEEPPKPSARLDTLGERSTASAERRRVDLRTLRNQLRGDLDWITMKALEKDRTRRYGSPSELAADVVRHMQDEPVLAGPPSTAYRARKFLKRHVGGVSVAAGVLVVLIGFAITMAVEARRISAERDRADTERRASDKVSGFLSKMLDSAKPEELGAALWQILHARVAEAALGRGAPKDKIDAAVASLDAALAGVSATDAALQLLDDQILARAGKTIEKDLAKEPRIAGRLETTLSDTYWHLGLYGPAELHGKRAVARAEEALGKDHRDTFAAMTFLGMAYTSQGRYDEAEKVFHETLERQRRVLGRDDSATLTTMHDLGAVYVRQRRFPEAESLLRETIEISRRVNGEEHADTLTSMQNLGAVYVSEERFDEAEKLFVRLIPLERRVMGEDHHEVLRSLSNLASSYQGLGRFKEADKLYEESLGIYRRKLGTAHPDTIRAMYNLANAYMIEARDEEAVKLFLETLDASSRVLGASHPDTLDCVYNLACLAARGGQRARAFDWLRRAVDDGWERADLMMKDDDLKSLRGDPAFEGCVSRARENGRRSK